MAQQGWPEATTSVAAEEIGRSTQEAADSTRQASESAAESGRALKDSAVDEGRQLASEAKGQAQEVASTAVERGEQVVQSAKAEARDLAETVRAEAGRLTSDLSEEGRSLAEETREHLQRQTEIQARRMADTFMQLGEEAQALVDGRPDEAPVVREWVAQAVDRFYDTSDRLHQLSDDVASGGIEVVLDDLQRFARRRPGAFLFGAAIAGFGIGRLVRSGRDGDGDAASAGNGAGRGPVTARVSSTRALAPGGPPSGAAISGGR